MAGRSSKRSISPAALAAEGVIAVGHVRGTSVCYVETEHALHVFHVDALPDRRLDERGLARARYLLDCGWSFGEAANVFDVSMDSLIKQMGAVGYVQPSVRVFGPRKGADARYNNRERHARFGGRK